MKCGEVIVHNEKTEGEIITIFSTASAVGKSVLSTNLAAQLAKCNYNVCLVDLDFQFGDVCHYLKLKPEYSFYDYQKDPDKGVSKYLLKYNDNLSVLAAPVKLEESYNIEAQIVIQAINELRKSYDYIVIDTASGFNEVNLVALDISKTIVFLGIVDFIPTIKNMKIGYGTMLNIGYPKEKIRFILNRSNAEKNINVKDVESILGEKFYHSLPNEFGGIINSLRTGIPLVYNPTSSEYGDSVTKLVEKLLGRVAKSNSGSWISRLFGG